MVSRRRAAPLSMHQEVDVLQILARMIRPAPPPVVEVARPVSRPLYEGMTTREYLELIKSRIAARRAEVDDILTGLARVEAERARIARMKADNAERETIRSSRFVINTKEK